MKATKSAPTAEATKLDLSARAFDNAIFPAILKSV
jgi:hypothetical protein